MRPCIPFAYTDLYDAAGNKRVARRLSHLPHNQTLALIQGLLETDGGVSRGKEIYFTSTSAPLAEGSALSASPPRHTLRRSVPRAGQCSHGHP